MSVKNVTLKENPTSITVTGGTDLTFATDGKDIPNGVHSIVTTDDFVTRRYAIFTNKSEVLDKKTAKWSKAKRKVSFVIPKLLADGITYSYNVMRVEFDVHPECDSDTILAYRQMVAQAVLSSALDGFLNVGDIS